MKAALTIVVAGGIAMAPLRTAHAAPAPATATHAQPMPVAPQADPQILSRARAFNKVGGTSLALGIGLVAMAGVTWGLRTTALRRADRQRFYVDEQRLIERARRRQVMTGVGLGVGAAMTLTGVALLVVGATTKHRAHRNVRFAPALAPGYGGVATRFRF